MLNDWYTIPQSDYENETVILLEEKNKYSTTINIEWKTYII
jgi:hypothetical protein